MADDKDKEALVPGTVKDATKDIAKDAAKDTIAAVAKEVYTDALKPSVSRLGDISGTLIGLLQMRMRKWAAMVHSADVERQIEFTGIQQALEARNVSADRIEAPSATVAGPALEAMVYAAEDPDLFGMFAALLAAAMDRETAYHARPAFVEILKQITPDEARMLKVLSQDYRSTKMYWLRTNPSNNQSTLILNHLWPIGHIANCEYLDLVPSYMDNFIRLGIFGTPEQPRPEAYFGPEVFGVVPPLTPEHADVLQFDTKTIFDAFRRGAEFNFSDYSDADKERIMLSVSRELKVVLDSFPLILTVIKNCWIEHSYQRSPLTIRDGLTLDSHLTQMTEFGKQFCDVCIVRERTENQYIAQYMPGFPIINP